MYYILAIVISLVVGYFYRDLRDKTKRLKELASEKKPEVGVNLGSYLPQDVSRINQDGEIGVVELKTPQQLEWEAMEKLREENLRVKVVQR